MTHLGQCVPSSYLIYPIQLFITLTFTFSIYVYSMCFFQHVLKCLSRLAVFRLSPCHFPSFSQSVSIWRVNKRVALNAALMSTNLFLGDSLQAQHPHTLHQVHPRRLRISTIKSDTASISLYPNKVVLASSEQQRHFVAQLNTPSSTPSRVSRGKCWRNRSMADKQQTQ